MPPRTAAAARAYLSGPHQPPAAFPPLSSDGLPPLYKRYQSPVRLDPETFGVLGPMLREINGLTRIRWMTGVTPAGPSRSRAVLTPGRITPSSGARYPVEVYVATGGEPDAGLYHYDPAHHCLDQLRTGDGRAELCSHLVAPTGGQGELVLLFTTVFWRNAAKYGQFGYRLQNLDAGVVLGQTLAVAQRRGFTARIHLRFRDHNVNRILGVDGYVESVVAAVVLSRDQKTAPDPSPGAFGPLLTTAKDQLPSITGVPDLADMARLHSRSMRDEPVRVYLGPDDRGRTAFTPLPTGRPDLQANAARRRTVYGYRPATVPVEDLGRLLGAVGMPVDTDLFDARKPDVYVVANTVAGLLPGCYRYEPGSGLAAVRAGDMVGLMASAAKTMMLADELSTAAFTVLVVHDYEAGLEVFGDRWYRMQTMAAGIAVQRVCLAASALWLDTHVHCDYAPRPLASALGIGTAGEEPVVLVTVGRAASNRADPQGEL